MSEPTLETGGASAAALRDEIKRLKAQLACAPAAAPGQAAAAPAAAPVYTDEDLVPEWTTPAELCGFRLDEEVTVGSEKRKAQTFRPGHTYRNVAYGVIRQAMALWGAYADSRRMLMVNRGQTNTYLGAMD